ncbi:MAG: hypothetical protein HFF02_03015 [Erysipelotrichaceae bacterium]|nr:hypothetical protein [Erysipelotrichaceae bacterium]
MAINVYTANQQANRLIFYTQQLSAAKNKLLNYQSSLSNHWQANEIAYITDAIKQTITQIDSAIKQLDQLAKDIKSTAHTIHGEEMKVLRINQAQTAFNQASQKLEKLKKEKSKLERLKNTCPSNKRSSYEKEIEEIKRKIKQAETNCNHTYNALLIAKRS